jgi:hypothetical protein
MGIPHFLDVNTLGGGGQGTLFNLCEAGCFSLRVPLLPLAGSSCKLLLWTDGKRRAGGEAGTAVASSFLLTVG